jgi:hypothetical protein
LCVGNWAHDSRCGFHSVRRLSVYPM